jgi:hypothetical protein
MIFHIRIRCLNIIIDILVKDDALLTIGKQPLCNSDIKPASNHAGIY